MVLASFVCFRVPRAPCQKTFLCCMRGFPSGSFAEVLPMGWIQSLIRWFTSFFVGQSVGLSVRCFFLFCVVLCSFTRYYCSLLLMKLEGGGHGGFVVVLKTTKAWSRRKPIWSIVIDVRCTVGCLPVTEPASNFVGSFKVETPVLSPRWLHRY